jgi:transposase
MQIGRNLQKKLEDIRLWNGFPLCCQLKQEIVREYERLEMIERQLRDIEKYQEQEVQNSSDKSIEKVRLLIQLKGIAIKSGWKLAKEFFWREFSNRREVGGAAGLTPTPYDSGDSVKEQGIGKDGNCRVRALMVQLAWGWLRYQSQSELSQWFNIKYVNGGKGIRKIGIVAVARKLLIQLWRYVEEGVVPPGARIKV